MILTKFSVFKIQKIKFNTHQANTDIGKEQSHALIQKWKHTARQELAERNPGVNSDHKVNSNANGISEKGCTSFWVMLGGNALRQSVNHLAS